jgi:hypothetical protein
MSEVDGHLPEHSQPIVWRSGGIDKAQRHRAKGGRRHQQPSVITNGVSNVVADVVPVHTPELVLLGVTDGGGDHAGRGNVDATRRCTALDERLEIEMIALGSRREPETQPPPNRHLTHGDAYRRNRAPRR